MSNDEFKQKMFDQMQKLQERVERLELEKTQAHPSSQNKLPVIHIHNQHKTFGDIVPDETP